LKILARAKIYNLLENDIYLTVKGKINNSGTSLLKGSRGAPKRAP